MSEFEVLVGVKLDETGIQNIKSQINNIKPEKIKIDLDMSNFEKQVNQMKSQLEGLGKLSVGSNVGKNVGSAVSKNIKDAGNSMKNLLSTMNQMKKIEMEMSKLSVSGKDIVDTSQYKKLEAEFNKVSASYENMISRFENTGKVKGISALRKEMDSLNVTITKTKGELAATINTNLNVGKYATEVAKLESSFNKLGTKSKEVTSAVQSVKDAFSSMNTAKEKGDVEALTNAENKYVAALKQANNLIKQQALSEPATKNVGNSVKQLQSTMEQMRKMEMEMSRLSTSGKGVVDTSQYEKLQSEFKKVSASYKDMISAFESTGKVTGIDALRKEMDSLNVAITKTKGELAATINTNLNTGKYAREVAQLETSFNKLSTKSKETVSAMTSVKNALSSMNTAKEKGNVEALTSAENKYIAALKQANNLIKQQAASDATTKNLTALSNQRKVLSNQIDLWMQNNSAATRQFGTQLQNLKSELASCNSVRLNGIKSEFQQITQQARLAGVATQTFGDKIKSSLMNLPNAFASSMSMYLSSTMLMMKAFSEIKEGINTVYDLDTALVDLQKTAQATASQLTDFYYEANEAAKEYGSTTQEIIQGAADWSRLGYNLQDSQTMAKYSSMMKSISPGMTYDKATEGLVSTMKAYGIEADDVLDGVMSKINIIGKQVA